MNTFLHQGQTLRIHNTALYRLYLQLATCHLISPYFNKVFAYQPVTYRLQNLLLIETEFNSFMSEAVII